MLNQRCYRSPNTRPFNPQEMYFVPQLYREGLSASRADVPPTSGPQYRAVSCMWKQFGLMVKGIPRSLRYKSQPSQPHIVGPKVLFSL